MSQPRPRVLLMGSEGMGRGDDSLGLTILGSFLSDILVRSDVLTV
jgi:hypothetical protein